MIRRFFRYCVKVFYLPKQLITLQSGEGRSKPEISGDAMWLSILSLFSLRIESLNALEQMFRDKKRRRQWHRLLGDRPPSADAIGYYAERLNCDSLRSVLHFIYTQLQRNRHVQKFRIHGWLMLAVDGHELFSRSKPSFFSSIKPLQPLSETIDCYHFPQKNYPEH